MGKFDHIENASERHQLELLDTLGKDPVARKALQKELKRLNPELHFPELEAENVVLEAEKRIDEKLSAREKADKDKEIQARITEGRKKLSEMGFQDSEIEDIEKRMVAGELANDYNKAGQVAVKERQLTTPREEYNPDDAVLSMPKGEEFKGLYENPNNWGIREAHKAINDINRTHGR
jgi:hypothetical protein